MKSDVNIKINLGDGEMAQLLSIHTALAEDPSSIASIHIKWLPTACNSIFRASEALIQPSSAPAPAHILTHKHIHLQIIKNNKNL